MEKVYQTYKSSDVEWVGEIPENWSVVKLNYYCSVIGGSTPKSNIDSYWGGEINWITPDDLGKLKNKNIYNSRRKITQSGLNNCSASLVGPNSLIISSRAPIGYLAINKLKTSTNQGCKSIVISKGLNVDYLYYYLLTAKTDLQSLGTGSTFTEISAFDLKNYKILKPALKEQTQIAKYLDYHTNKIDQLIAKKESLIEKLKEQRQAIINETVTKGLNKEIKLIDSGIEWLGEIPEHWEVSRLFGLCGFVRGNSSFKKDELLAYGEYIALQYGKTYKVNVIDDNYKFYVNNEFYKESQVVNNGDIIIISTSETIEDLGHSVFYDTDDIGLLGGEQIALKSKKGKLNSKYLFYSSKVFLKSLRRFATGVKVYRFNISDLKNIHIGLPPIYEQDLIVNQIESKSLTTEKILLDTAISIEKLKEYRQSFISKVVTGKIDVRDWVAPKQ